MSEQTGSFSLAIIGSRSLSRENEVRVRLYLEQEFELDLDSISVIVSGGAAGACLAVLDKPLEESKGTRDCVNRFRKLGKQVFVLELDARPESGNADFDELSK